MSVTEAQPIREEAYDYDILDADFHVNVPAEELLEYIDDPVVVEKLEDAGMPPGTNGGFSATYASGVQDGLNAHGIAIRREEILELLPEYAIDGVIATPGHINLATARYPVVKNAIARAYNDFVVDHVLAPEEDIYGLVMLPHWDVDASVEEVNRLGDERGIVGAQGWYSPMQLFGGHQFDPMYDALVEHDLPFVLHGSGYLPRFDVQADSLQTRGEGVIMGWGFNALKNVVSMIYTGVFDEFSTLDVLVQEAGTTWLPYIANRMDEKYQSYPGDIKITERKHASGEEYLDRLPSEYLYDRFTVTTQPTSLPKRRREAEHLLEVCRAGDMFLFSSDWPHQTLDTPNWVFENPAIDDDLAAAILGGNARDLFGI